MISIHTAPQMFVINVVRNIMIVSINHIERNWQITSSPLYLLIISFFDDIACTSIIEKSKLSILRKKDVPKATTVFLKPSL